MLHLLFTAATGALLLLLFALVYFVRLQARYPEPSHADEIHIVTAPDGWRLRLHRRKPKGGGGEPVFFMHSLSSNHLNFEVPYGYSLVDYLLNAGYDCWTFDSRACRDAVPPKRAMRFTSTVDDLLTKDIPLALRHIRGVTGYPRIHWVGHSMGGMLFYAYDLKFDGDGLASATTLGSPPGFKGFRIKPRPGLLRLNRNAHTLCSLAFRGAAPFFDFWRPESSLVPINWDNVHPKLRAPHLFHAAEMPTPTIGEQMYAWASGAPWRMCGGSLDIDANLHRLRTPLFAVFGGLDPFISLARAREFFGAIENKDKRMLFLSRANGHSANYNHIDLAFAREGEREVFGPILQWLRAHPANGAKRGAAKRAARKPAAGGIERETPKPEAKKASMKSRPASARTSAKKPPKRAK